MDQIIPNLIEAGVADEDIRKAVEIGQRVKDAAADYMREVADVLAGTRLAVPSQQGQTTDETTPDSGGCCG
jgi:predicted HAD superfamily phosphohydrolase